MSNDCMEPKDQSQTIALVQTLAIVVQNMMQENIPYNPRTLFDASRAPNISVKDYLHRIFTYASCSMECFVLALVYIDRLVIRDDTAETRLYLNELNIHRVLISSIVLAAKFFDDHYFNNAYYSRVGGISCTEMNQLEVEFLTMVNFRLHVTADCYLQYYNALTQHNTFQSIFFKALYLEEQKDSSSSSAIADVADVVDNLAECADPCNSEISESIQYYHYVDYNRDGLLEYITRRERHNSSVSEELVGTWNDMEITLENDVDNDDNEYGHDGTARRKYYSECRNYNNSVQYTAEPIDIHTTTNQPVIHRHQNSILSTQLGTNHNITTSTTKNPLICRKKRKIPSTEVPLQVHG